MTDGLEVELVVPERDVEISLRVEPGQTLALLGPNGSGKSTLLGVVSGLLRPEPGQVRLAGRVLTDVGPGRPGTAVAPHRRRTALLSQDALLFPHLTALENVAFGPRSAGTARAEARRRARGWLDDVGVGDLAARRPAQLSGGQAQRVALARALAAEPDLLLLDEPMAALDVAVMPALRQTLRRVLEGRSAIVVTHDPLDALLLADRVVVLDSGRVVEEGPVADVLGRPRTPFAARLAGLNLVSGRWDVEGSEGSEGSNGSGVLRADDGTVVHGRPPTSTPTAGVDVVAAFRPHAVAVYRDPPSGSPRNVLDVTVTAVEPHGDLVRVRADASLGPLTADVTVQAAADLQLTPGDRVAFVVKATEVDLYER